MLVVLNDSQLIVTEAVLSWSPSASRRTDRKFEMPVMVDSDFHIDRYDLTRGVGGLYSRRIVIIVHSTRATILDLSADTLAPKARLVYIIVQGCRLVKAPE